MLSFKNVIQRWACFSLIFTLSVTATAAYGQTAPLVSVARAARCEKYEESMRLGNRSLAADSSGMALRRFQDAQIAARQCNIPGKEAAEGIIKAFMDINNKKLMSEKKANEAQSLALSSQAFTEIYKNGNVTKAFRYARNAFLKDPTNLNAQVAMNMAVYQPDREIPLELFYYDIPNADYYFDLDADPCGKVFFMGVNSVKVIDVASGKTRVVTDIGTQAIQAMDADADIKYALSPAGTLLYVHMLYMDAATHEQVEEVNIFDIMTGKKDCTLKGRDRKSVYFSPGDKKIVFSDERMIWSFDVATGALSPAVPFPGRTIDPVVFSGDGGVFAIPREGANDSLALFVLGTDKLGVRESLALNSEELNSWTLSNDGAHLLLKRGDKPAEVYGTSPLRLIPGARPDQFHFPQGLYVTRKKIIPTAPDAYGKITAKGDDELLVTDLARDKSIKYLQPSGGEVSNFNEVVFSPDRKRFVTTSGHDYFGRGDVSGYPFTLWDAVTGKSMVTVPRGDISSGPVQELSVLFSSDGKYLLTSNHGKKVTLWDAARGKELARLSHTEIVDKAVFSSDNKYIITITRNFLLKKWPVGNVADPSYLPGQIDTANMSFHRAENRDKVTRTNDKNYDMNKIVMTLPDTSVKIRVTTSFMSRDRNNNARKRMDRMDIIHSGVVTNYYSVKESLKDYVNYMLTARISANGRYMLGTYGTVVKVSMNSYNDFSKYSVLWDIATGRMIARLNIPNGIFSPDGKFLLMDGGPETTLVDVKSGTELARFRAPANISGRMNYCDNQVIFSADGKKVLIKYSCGDSDGSLRASSQKAYIIDPGSLMSVMNDIGDLTEDENARYNTKGIPAR